MFKKMGWAVGFLLVCTTAQATSKLEFDTYTRGGSDWFAPDAPWVLQHSFSLDETTGSFYTYKIWPPGLQLEYLGGYPRAHILDPGYVRLVLTPPQDAGNLAVGLYENAKRSPYQNGVPGIDMTIDSTSITFTSGRFQVYDVKFNDDGNVTSLAASFELVHTNLSPNPFIKGRIWFNSDAAIPSVPEPSAVALLLAGIAAGALLKKKSTAKV
ncbi:MAG: hypothetical protein C0487_02850 [Leptothrix sp. (in: Bacteria)]|nr:hypothetical protein [Leptothrix sp. (in: b-proteobacteria)]